MACHERATDPANLHCVTHHITSHHITSHHITSRRVTLTRDAPRGLALSRGVSGGAQRGERPSDDEARWRQEKKEEE